jgi:periplasmic divalent cation tolerance protein
MTQTPAAGAVLLLTTFGTRDDAERAGETLVEGRLAACGSVIPVIHSFFYWEGRLQREHESLLLLKTTAAGSARLQDELRRLHPYENPEILEVPVSGGSADYLAWVAAEVGGPRPVPRGETTEGGGRDG